jgi:hypothetical protein
MREQSRSISRGLKINKNSAEGEVFLIDFPSYRTLQTIRKTTPLFDSRLDLLRPLRESTSAFVLLIRTYDAGTIANDHGTLPVGTLPRRLNEPS